jgi:hypothetical protein
VPAAPGPARVGERLAAGDAELLVDEVDPGHELGHWVLDLQPCVQLDEVERLVRPEQELERPGVRVADRSNGPVRRRLHLLAETRLERRRRRLLDQLLVATLDRALALAERQHAAVCVAEHLDLDMPRRNDRLLEVEAPVAERRLRLGRRGRVGAVELARRGDEPHPLPASAGRRLQEDGVAKLARHHPCLLPRDGLSSGNERNARGPHLRPGRRLVAHLREHLRRRPDKDEVVVGARLREGRVLREEAPAGMDRLAAGGRSGCDHGRDPKVALRRRRRADADRAIRHPDVHRALVRRRVDRDGLAPQLVQRTDHAHGHLAAVRDENPVEAQNASSGRPSAGSISNSSCPNSTGCPFST